jgi:hypothetical protein
MICCLILEKLSFFCMFQECILLSVPCFIFIREEYVFLCAQSSRGNVLQRETDHEGWTPYDNERIWNVLKYPAGYVWDRRLRQSIGIQDWQSCLKSARASREQRITRDITYKINNKKERYVNVVIINLTVFHSICYSADVCHVPASISAAAIQILSWVWWILFSKQKYFWNFFLRKVLVH